MRSLTEAELYLILSWGTYAFPLAEDEEELFQLLKDEAARLNKESQKKGT